MITIIISGGLGNQFFQYAVAEYIKSINNQQITIKYVSKTAKEHAERIIGITKFKIPNTYSVTFDNDYFQKQKLKYFCYKVINRLFRKFDSDDIGEKRINRFKFYLYNQFGMCIQERHRYYYPKIKNNIYIYGMWHTPLIADKIRDRLLEEYKLKDELLTDTVKTDIENIIEHNTVCVHVRRGDYLTASGFATCSLDYYKKSIKLLRERLENPSFVIFSDDTDWCRENLIADDITYAKEGNPDYIDFELMRNCRHFIISNSTYSWWAAYLGTAADKTVVTPKEWFPDCSKSWLNLPEWIEMEN